MQNSNKPKEGKKILKITKLKPRNDQKKAQMKFKSNCEEIPLKPTKLRPKDKNKKQSEPKITKYHRIRLNPVLRGTKIRPQEIQKHQKFS